LKERNKILVEYFVNIKGTVDNGEGLHDRGPRFFAVVLIGSNSTCAPQLSPFS